MTKQERLERLAPHPRIVGVGGEGITRKGGKHVYVCLAAVREDGKVLAEISDPAGLSHETCVELLLSLPKGSLCFSFDCAYDATKIFEGVNDIDLFLITHPEVRRESVCRSCGKCWRQTRTECPKCGNSEIRTFTPLHRVGARGFTIDRDGYTVTEGRHFRQKGEKKEAAWRRSTRVWNAAGFTHRLFDESLESFGVVGNLRTFLESVKANKHPSLIALRAACQLECRLTAQIIRRCLTTLRDAGIDLKAYRGAGSIAGALTHKHNMAARRGPSQHEIEATNPELATAIMSAYFGGREEIAVQGEVKGPLWEYDIAGAYPFALTKLPCLTCGSWHRYKASAPRKAAPTLVHFRVSTIRGQRGSAIWAPLPCRTDEGPVWGANFEGWAWRPEVEAAMHRWPGLVEILDGWAYLTSCKHEPFAWISQTYAQRCNLERTGEHGGAELLKAGLAAVYGKTAQRFEAPVQSYVWAGMATSLIRARVLDVLGAHVVSVATDAVISRKRLRLRSKKGLGAWKEARSPGAFLAAPGLFLARGEGAKIRTACLKEAAKVTVTETGFFAARDSVVAMIRCTRCGLMWDLKHGFACPAGHGISGVPRAERLKTYGTWGAQRREISLTPEPMRYGTSVLGHNCRQLHVRDLEGAVSLPYESV